jgi:hypothetical protein
MGACRQTIVNGGHAVRRAAARRAPAGYQHPSSGKQEEETILMTDDELKALMAALVYRRGTEESGAEAEDRAVITAGRLLYKVRKLAG